MSDEKDIEKTSKALESLTKSIENTKKSMASIKFPASLEQSIGKADKAAQDLTKSLAKIEISDKLSKELDKIKSSSTEAAQAQDEATKATKTGAQAVAELEKNHIKLSQALGDEFTKRDAFITILKDQKKEAKEVFDEASKAHEYTKNQLNEELALYALEKQAIEEKGQATKEETAALEARALRILQFKDEEIAAAEEVKVKHQEVVATKDAIYQQSYTKQYKNIEELTKKHAQEAAKQVDALKKTTDATGKAVTEFFNLRKDKITADNKLEMDALKESTQAAQQAYDEKIRLLDDEEQATIASYDTKSAELQANLLSGAINQEQYEQQIKALRDERNNALSDSTKDMLATEQKALDGAVDEEKTRRKKQIDEENKAGEAAFNAEKVNKLASIGMNTASAILGAWASMSAIPIVGPGLALAQTLAIGAAGVMQADDVRKEQFKKANYASGTAYHEGGVALVGEAGPEMVNLPKGSSVMPAGKTKNALKEEAKEVVVNINGDVINSKDTGKQSGKLKESQIKQHKADLEAFSDELINDLEEIADQGIDCANEITQALSEDLLNKVEPSMVQLGDSSNDLFVKMGDGVQPAVDAMEDLEQAYEHTQIAVVNLGLEAIIQFESMWGYLDEMSTRMQKFDLYVSDLTGAMSRFGGAVTQSLSPMIEKYQAVAEKQKEVNKLTKDHEAALQKVAAAQAEFDAAKAGDDVEELAKKLDKAREEAEKLNDELAKTEGELQKASAAAEITGMDVAQMGMQIAGAMANLAAEITKAVFDNMQRKMEAQHKKELKLLDKKKKEHKEYWDDVKKEHAKAMAEMEKAEKQDTERQIDKYSELTRALDEKFANGLLSEKEYREELALLKEEEQAAIELAEEEEAAKAEDRRLLEEEMAARELAEQEKLEAEEKALEAKQAKEKDARAKKAFEAEKVNTLAQIGINTAMAIIGAWASQSAIPIVGPVLAGVQTGIVTALGITQMAAVKSKQYQSQLYSGSAYAQGGSTLVGEGGPELVNLPTGSEVLSAGKTRNELSGSRGDVVINIHGNIFGMKDLENIITKAIAKSEEKLLGAVAFATDSGYSLEA